jgi:SAM-dependent methyltransferase
MRIKTRLRYVFRDVFPTCYFFLQYHRAKHLVNDRFGYEYRKARERFLEEANRPGQKCLQIGVKESEGGKFGPNWLSVDKFDMRPFIDFHDDVHSLHFADNTFDAATCLSILEHLPTPWIAIKELHRVLKPESTIWISMPMTYPYHEDPKDYWRASPEGLRIWMNGLFDERTCGTSYWTGSSLVAATHYIGTTRK